MYAPRLQWRCTRGARAAGRLNEAGLRRLRVKFWQLWAACAFTAFPRCLCSSTSQTLANQCSATTSPRVGDGLAGAGGVPEAADSRRGTPLETTRLLSGARQSKATHGTLVHAGSAQKVGTTHAPTQRRAASTKPPVRDPPRQPRAALSQSKQKHSTAPAGCHQTPPPRP